MKKYKHINDTVYRVEYEEKPAYDNKKNFIKLLNYCKHPSLLNLNGLEIKYNYRTFDKQLSVNTQQRCVILYSPEGIIYKITDEMIFTGTGNRKEVKYNFMFDVNTFYKIIDYLEGGFNY